MILPKAGMKIAAPAMVKKLTNAITVPEMVIGKSSLAWEYTTIPNAPKKPIKKKVRPYQKGSRIFITPIRGKRLMH